MQAIAYGVFEQDGEGFMSAAFALPGCVLEGVLRLERCAPGAGVRLTSEPRAGGDPRGQVTGVFLHTPFGRVRLPLSESLALWDAADPECPAELRADPSWAGSVVVGSHEQRLWGVALVRHSYWFSPAPEDAVETGS
jgi:hypothetical protein